MCAERTFGFHAWVYKYVRFIHNGDVYVLIITTKTILRVTQTIAEESNTYFLANDAIVVYQSGNSISVGLGFIRFPPPRIPPAVYPICGS